MSFTLAEIQSPATKLSWNYDPVELANVDGFRVEVDGVPRATVTLPAALEVSTNAFSITADGSYVATIVPFNSLGDGPVLNVPFAVVSGTPPLVAPTNGVITV